MKKVKVSLAKRKPSIKNRSNNLYKPIEEHFFKDIFLKEIQIKNELNELGGYIKSVQCRIVYGNKVRILIGLNSAYPINKQIINFFWTGNNNTIKTRFNGDTTIISTLDCRDVENFWLNNYGILKSILEVSK